IIANSWISVSGNDLLATLDRPASVPDLSDRPQGTPAGVGDNRAGSLRACCPSTRHISRDHEPAAPFLPKRQRPERHSQKRPPFWDIVKAGGCRTGRRAAAVTG